MAASCPTAPSSASVCQMLNGDPEGVPKFIGHWMLRSVLIMPGLAIAGVRDRRLIVASLVSSSFVSAFLVAFTAFEKSRRKNRKQPGRSNRLAARNRQFARAHRLRQLHAGA